MSSNLWEPAVACNSNLWFPRWQPGVPTFGNRQFLAMNQTQTFWYRSIKQNNRFCYRLSKKNKTTLRTMSSTFLESTDPSTGNVCFFRLGTMNFKLWESAAPFNDSCLASKTQILTSGNRQFLAMVTSGSQVGNRKFQGLGTGSSLPW